MNVAHPAVLIALLLLPWLWRARMETSRARVIWRVLTASVVILGAAGVGIRTGMAPLSVVAVLDRSASMSRTAQQHAVERVNAVIRTMGARDRVGIITVGADAIVERKLAPSRPLTVVTTSPADSASDLASGLRAARSLLPPDGADRVLLVSDGQETTGNVEREALEAQSAGIAIDVATPADVTAAPVRVNRLVGPSDVAAHEPYLVSAEIVGPPGARADVVMYRDDELVESGSVTVGTDGQAAFTLSDQRDGPRSYIYRAGIEATDGFESQREQAGHVVTVSDAARVLYVSEHGGTLQATLRRAGFVVREATPTQVPVSPAALSEFAAIVVDDVGADRFPEESLEAVRAYVEQAGGGLLLLGSAHTLSVDGYPASPLEPILPIDLRPRTGARTTAVALVVVFDKSGSMADLDSGVSKIEVARQAVGGVADVLPASDAFGVIAFDSQPVPVAPIAAGVIAGALRSRLAAVSPGGATAVAPALDLATRWLHAGAAANAMRRQILLLSDGHTSPGDAERMRDVIAAHPDVMLSVVAIGTNANRALLEPLARSTGGRAYFPGSVRDLPRLVAREAAQSAGGGVVAERFVPRPTPHPVLTGLDSAAFPSLDGYVVGALKPTGTAILSSPLGDPVLSSSQAGLGRVVLFSGDLAGRWGRAFRSWDDAARLWSQTVRWLSRHEADRELHVAIADGISGTRLRVEFERPGVSVESVRATVHTAGEVDRDLVLTPVAPGQYSAALPVVPPGPSVIAVTARGQRGEERRVVRTIYYSADREHRSTGINRPLLNRLAAVTGGRVLGAEDSPFVFGRSRGYRDTAPAVLTAGLVMFVIELTVTGLRGARFGRQGRGLRRQGDLITPGAMTPIGGGTRHG